ncbi:hypothetical protein [Lysobacter enzymogenes]|uniref:MoxR-vWA-beta-propeller ternary system domain-containing protein n=1 Tax=Lysobacter enzymogenes TaxID=69 RepID=A0A3N2RHK6_LYSEN|nr:hypothetical protein [Lysobacter enzymogenes]ROU06980.1 hypothetical protein D9T17_10680 [Lysobacter enzymogenes]
MKWSWGPEPEPPPPQGAAGVGRAVSRALMAAVQALDPARRDTLALTANADVLVATGPADALPWCEGVLYIAPREPAPALWLPTTQRPQLPLDLLQRALARRHPQSPLLMLREPARLVPLHRALPASDELIAQIRARWQD